MCGIVGFLDKKNKLAEKDKERLIEKMISCVNHRGRDDAGFYVSNKVVIGHTRLSILDLTKNGVQPFFNEDKTVVLSYNGEIYNYRELNKDLETKGYALTSQCDTETVLYSCVDEGADCLAKLNGMFAFSLYDKKADTITLAVDRFSIKPLYYINTDDWFAWSSEIKSLPLLPGFKPELNETLLPEYFLFRQTAGEETLFKNIHRLTPAQIVTYAGAEDAIEKKIFWRLEKKPLGDMDIEETLFQKLSESVKSHLLADVPVGVQLSGGVDSSLVAALANEHIRSLNTYSIGLKDGAWNEFRYSRPVAEQFKTTHHELTFTEADFCRALPRLTYFHDEPINHSHSVPMYLLAEEARKDVKVLLSGEGADEVFFGYRRYLDWFKAGAEREKITMSSAFGTMDGVKKVLRSSQSPSFDYRERVLREAMSFSPTDQMSAYDIQTYLPPLLLRQDKMGMAANLENRVPFLDYKLVEFGFSLPEKYKINDTDTKVAIKQLARRFFSNDFVYRPKCGFSQPLGEWLRNKRGLGAYLKLFDKNNERRSFLNYSYIQEMIETHFGGADNTSILWPLINLELWLRIFIDGIKPEDVISVVYE